jgi:hypothetical protein
VTASLGFHANASHLRRSAIMTTRVIKVIKTLRLTRVGDCYVRTRLLQLLGLSGLLELSVL